ncbi:unnamed protein product, partial [Staurois parvus]
PASAHQCHLYQCLPSSVPNQCHLLVPISAVLSVPITAASLVHISEGEKSLIYKI